MKKVFRAAYGDLSRVLIILADNIDEAIELANTTNEDDDPDEWEFTFTKDDIIEMNLSAESTIVEDWRLEGF